MKYYTIRERNEMRYDVVVVGAGPAGATAAKYLAEQHLQVLLLEKETLPRNKPCGGVIPLKILKMFPYLDNQDVITSYSYGGSIYYGSFRHPLTVHLEQPCASIVIRSEFDHRLVQMAVASGAILHEGTTATDISMDDEKATITLNDGSMIEAAIVIGADGVWSTVAKKTGLDATREPVCLCVHEEYPLDRDRFASYVDDRNFFTIIFCFEGIEGYGWVFPKKSHINIGIGAFAYTKEASFQKRNFKDLYKRYITALTTNGILPKDYRIGNLRGAALPSHPLQKAYSDRVLLVGDAAGLLNPITGGGIYYAMTSGMLAASVAAQAIRRGDTSARFLSKYEDLFWSHSSGKELRLMIRLRKRWGDRIEQFFTVVSSDKRLMELAVKFVTGEIDTKTIRRSLILRFAYVYGKTLLSRRRAASE
jgi:geranylgeranyl reductase family protein